MQKGAKALFEEPYEGQHFFFEWSFERPFEKEFSLLALQKLLLHPFAFREYILGYMSIYDFRLIKSYKPKVYFAFKTPSTISP